MKPTQSGKGRSRKKETVVKRSSGKQFRKPPRSPTPRTIPQSQHLPHHQSSSESEKEEAEKPTAPATRSGKRKRDEDQVGAAPPPKLPRLAFPKGAASHPFEIEAVDADLKKVDAEIEAVEADIEKVEAEMQATADKDERTFLRTKESQLREKENKLREKENKLREKENLLLKSQAAGIVSAGALLSFVPCSRFPCLSFFSLVLNT